MSHRNPILLLISIVVVMFSVTACNSHAKTDELRALVEQWQGKEINFPDVMTDVLTGDTIDIDGADFTILTYIDSANCKVCKMKLPIWNRLLESIDSITHTVVNVIMVVNSRDEDGIRNLLEKNSCNIQVYLDSVEGFKKKNQLMINPKLRTFLLSKSHQVIGIGNPTYNGEINRLYQSIISGRKVYGKRSELSIKQSHHDFGDISLGQEAACKFVIENTGTDTIYISDIVSSCPCTSVIPSKNYVLPEDTLSLTVNYKQDSLLGEFNNSIHIYYNGINTPNVISIAGFTTN